jgi:hypothetical protein
VHIGFSRYEPACSINGYVMTSNAAIHRYEPPPLLFDWLRRTRNEPLSYVYCGSIIDSWREG